MTAPAIHVAALAAATPPPARKTSGDSPVRPPWITPADWERMPGRAQHRSNDWWRRTYRTAAGVEAPMLDAIDDFEESDPPIVPVPDMWEGCTVPEMIDAKRGYERWLRAGRPGGDFPDRDRYRAYARWSAYVRSHGGSVAGYGTRREGRAAVERRATAIRRRSLDRIAAARPYAEAGMQTEEIAVLLGVTRRSLRRTLTRYAADGGADVAALLDRNRRHPSPLERTS